MGDRIVNLRIAAVAGAYEVVVAEVAAAASGKALDEERSAAKASAEWASRKKKRLEFTGETHPVRGVYLLLLLLVQLWVNTWRRRVLCP